ncbi:MAG: hypothetical protein JW889_06605 [Verrucomicrobia bacterium]|nr:hypothetical protein [Verrucomicrobiota bacterium]
MAGLSDLSQQINEFVDLQVERVPEVFQAPGAAYVLLGAIGIIYMIFGLKVYKFVLALIMLSIAGGVTWFVTEGDILITALVAFAAGLLAFLLQYVFMLLIAGAVFAGIVFVGLYAAMERADIPLIAAAIAIGLGVFLAVKLFKFIIIFSTSAIGAACVTGSFWILYQNGEFPGVITQNVQFDPALFNGIEFPVGLTFAGCLLVGILIQAIILAATRKRAAGGEEG